MYTYLASPQLPPTIISHGTFTLSNHFWRLYYFIYNAPKSPRVISQAFSVYVSAILPLTHSSFEFEANISLSCNAHYQTQPVSLNENGYLNNHPELTNVEQSIYVGLIKTTSSFCDEGLRLAWSFAKLSNELLTASPTVSNNFVSPFFCTQNTSNTT